MKIAVFYNLRFGGAKRVVMEQVKGLSKLGHRVDVYTIDQYHDIFDPGQYAAHEYRYTFSSSSHTVPVISRLVKDYQVLWNLRSTHRRIAQDINKKNYDIALIHTDTNTQAPFILRYLTTCNVYYCLEPLRIGYEYALRPPDTLSLFNQPYEIITRYLRKKIDRDNARSAQHTTAISLFGRECMIQAYDLYPKISYIGVDTTLFRPKRIKKKNQVLFVAEKQYIYGYDLAQKAMELLPKKNSPELKILSWTNKSKDRVSDEELVNLYNESLVTLSLSRFDTFGLVPLESMACQTPVIALNVAGYKETMVDTKTGFLVDFDPVAIADKILYCITNKNESEKMGKFAASWVQQHWTWETHVKKLEELLKQFSQRP